MKKLKPRGRPTVRLEGNRHPGERPTGPSGGPSGPRPPSRSAPERQPKITSEVRAETGREFKIAGPASFTFFPSFGMRVRDVSLSAPPDMGGEPLLTAQSLDVGVRLWPLIHQDIVVDRLVLTKPVFNLRVDAKGRRSWDMAAGPAPVRFRRRGSADVDFWRNVAGLYGRCGGPHSGRFSRSTRTCSR